MDKQLFICKKLEFMCNPIVKNVIYACNCYMDYYIAVIKLSELHNLVCMAKRFIIKSNNYFNEFENTGDKSNLIDSSDMLKSSILTYNSCMDYISQAVWFGYSLYDNYPGKKKKSDLDIEKEKDYIAILRSCSIKNIKHVLGEINNSSTSELEAIINKFYENKQVKILKDLANTLKHNGNYEFDGLQQKEDFEIISMFDENGKDRFKTSLYKTKVYNINETICIVKRVHLELMKYVHKVIDFMGIVNMINDYPHFATEELLDSNIELTRIAANSVLEKKLTKEDIHKMYKNSAELQKENDIMEEKIYNFINRYNKIKKIKLVSI